MDCQYKYVFVGDSNYYGFLSYCPGECVDQVAEEGIINHSRQTAVRVTWQWLPVEREKGQTHKPF